MKLDALAKYDTPTITNAMDSLGIAPRSFLGPRIRALAPGAPVVGIAVTCTMKEQWGGKFSHLEPWLKFLEEIESALLPCVAIFHDDSAVAGREAMIGEGMARVMRIAGAVGVICDGSVRDVGQLRGLDLAIWSSGVVVDRGSLRFHQFQIPVEIDGMQVKPGDLIHADENGAVVVPMDRAEEIAEAAVAVSAREARLFPMFAQPDFRVAKLRDFYADALRSARGEF